MPFNVNKCKVMHAGNNNQNNGYDIEGLPIDVVTEEKDLGVIISRDLKVDKQCSKAANTANRILGLIRRSIVNRSKNIMIKLYKSLVRPYLDYCIQIWKPYLNKDIITLEKVQRRFSRMVQGLTNLSYEERLKRLGLTTLETRHLRADLLEVFKIMTDKEKVDKDKFFCLNTRKFRGHQYKIYKKNRFDLIYENMVSAIE